MLPAVYFYLPNKALTQLIYLVTFKLTEFIVNDGAAILTTTRQWSKEQSIWNFVVFGKFDSFEHVGIVIDVVNVVDDVFVGFDYVIFSVSEEMHHKVVGKVDITQ